MKRIKTIAMFAVLAVCLGGLSYAIAIQAKSGSSESPSTTEPQTVGAPVATPATKGPRMDVVFAIDATGSMGDEIDNIKSEVWSIAKKLATGQPKPDIRFGLVLYKDKGDDFLVKTTDLTRDLDKIEGLFKAIEVSGGGDNPEHVGRGLHAALDMSWDSKAAVRTIYLVGDAPAHTDYNDGFDLEAAIKRAAEARIHINTIGCSGITTGGGKTQFAQIASRTQGSFEPLTYQTIVKDDDGTEKSIIVYDGETYEAAGVLDKKEWSRGGGGLIKSGKLKPAKPALRRRAKKKGYKNNLSTNIKRDVTKSAEKLKVKFK